MEASTAQIVTWLIVITGWFFINHQANRREDRKETRQAIDSISRQSERICELAEEYHCQSGDKNQLNLARQIKVQLTDLIVTIPRLQLLDRNEFSLAADLRKAITLKHFDNQDLQPLAPDDEIFFHIEEARRALIDRLEEKYSESYRVGAVKKLLLRW
ncbi:hypothetical protein [Zhongshania sp.]|jgi:hypothetical protein|uniref:hypothetical protein n=1 Tax=Zhongshania sp. TaxID=1971902 RepID=UPI002A7FF8EB|nr:hypothetical protein [Zhongshania sp.]